MAPAAAPRAAAVRYAHSCSETTVPTSAEQAAEQPAAPDLRRILIGQRVDAAIHVQLAAIQAQLADVQALSADHQHARAGTQL